MDENKPVLVADGTPEEEATSQHGEYGADWIYESDAPEGSGDTEQEGGDVTDPEGGETQPEGGTEEGDSATEDEQPSQPDAPEEEETQGDEPDAASDQAVDTEVEDEEAEAEAFDHAAAADESRGIVKLVHINLGAYTEQMGRSRRIPDDAAVQKQRDLYLLIKRILHSNAADFREGMDALLGYFRRNDNDAFSKRMMFRYLDQVPLSPEDHKQFTSLLRLFLQCANPATRAQGLKTVDIRAVVNRMENAEAGSNLLAYFSVDD